MTVLLWLLLYPLVAATSTAIRVRTTDMDVGRQSKAQAAVYLTGTIILLTLHYV
jgi:hypothetical protein